MKKKIIAGMIAYLTALSMIVSPAASISAHADVVGTLTDSPDSAVDIAEPTEVVRTETSDLAEELKIVGKADISFIIDTTGSMGDEIRSVKENLSSFVTSLKNGGVSLNMSMIEYRDINCDGPDSTIFYDFDGSKWTDDADKLIAVLDSISVNGGGDRAETPLDAFEKLQLDFPREDASHFIFLLTDADYYDYEDTEENKAEGHYSMAAWTEKYRLNDVKVTVVGSMSDEDVYHYLYTMTGGKFIDINSSDYSEVMTEYSEWIYEKATDSDGDGIPDEWEIGGVDTDHDGEVDLDLSKLGADPRVPDIFIELDWMDRAGTTIETPLFSTVFGAKNTAPTAAALRMVYDQFKAHGINIHIDAGPDSIMNYETGETWGELSGGSALEFKDVFDLGSSYENWNRLALDNFTKARWTTFRYCLFANRYDAGRGTSSSGIAENLPGQFFIVATDCVDTTNYDTALAGTLMHELGHTLGLSHGGLHYADRSTEIENDHNHYKPNHLSIMNYTYQFSGLKTLDGKYVADYQGFDLPEINEYHVNENDGIDPYGATADSNYTFKLSDGSTYVWVDTDDTPAGQAIDFNNNGVIEEDVAINLDKEPNGTDERLDYCKATLNEWDHLKFVGGLVGGYGKEMDIDHIDLDTVTTLIEKPSEAVEKELTEISIEEAFEKGLIGDPKDCRFGDNETKKAFEGVDDQVITVDIFNLNPKVTNVKLTVVSDVVEKDFLTDVEVPADGKIECPVPVLSSAKAGTYDVVYTMELENGSVLEQKGTIVVEVPSSYQMTYGDVIAIPSGVETLCWTTNSSIVDIDGGKIIAKDLGKAFIGVNIGEDVYCAKVTVEDILLGLLGDITGDGFITSADALYVLRMSVDLEDRTDIKTFKIADIDNNESITSADALEILRFSVDLSDNKFVLTEIYQHKPRA